MRLAFVVAILSVGAASPALADDDTTRARAHFEIGNGMYRLGDYRGALREFAAGYELTKKPGFLINLGQTYRKLHEIAHAREMYRQYLASTPPEDPSRAQVQQILGELEREKEEPPPPEPSPAPLPQILAPPVVVTHAPPPPRKRRSLQIAGIVLGVVGVGLVAGGGGAAAAAEGVASDLTALDRAGGTFDPAKDDQFRVDRALEYSLFGVGAALAVAGVILIAAGSR